MESEPIRRVIAIETTAIVSGRALEYKGELLPDILRQSLLEAYETGKKDGITMLLLREELLQRILLKP